MQVKEYDREYLQFIYNFLTDDKFIDKLEQEEYKREYYMLVSSCDKIEKEQEKECVDCYVLKTLYKILSKYLSEKHDKFYEIILLTYDSVLQNLERIKNKYNKNKSSFNTYLYFYIKKYLFENIKKSFNETKHYVNIKKINYEMILQNDKNFYEL